jgi:hypothetical protein
MEREPKRFDVARHRPVCCYGGDRSSSARERRRLEEERVLGFGAKLAVIELRREASHPNN